MTNPAYQQALKLLSRRDHFSAELEEKLERKGFEADAVAEAVARCRELGLVDDEQLALRFVELRSVDRGWGPQRLEAELRRRGVASELAGRASRCDPERLELALQRAAERAERRAKQGWWRLSEGRARMVSSLIGRGFDAQDARRAVTGLVAAREKDHDATHDQQGDPPGLP